jgi:sec-independent protein translocase protein TatB
MFDFGFSELMLIALVALIVVGPERLPKVARTAGHMLGRLQRYVGDVKSDIQREMQLEDLKKLQQQVEQQARDLESTVRGQMASVEADLGKTAADIKQGVEGAAAPVAEVAVEAASGNSLLGAAAATSPDVAGAALAPAADEAVAAAPQAEPSPQLELGLDPAQASAKAPVEKA